MSDDRANPDEYPVPDSDGPIPHTFAQLGVTPDTADETAPLELDDSTTERERFEWEGTELDPNPIVWLGPEDADGAR